MALFDSIISEAATRFGLSTESAGGLLAALLGLIADPNKGGFGGFIGRFRGSGLGGVVDSWIGTGESEELNGEQLEAAIGGDNLSALAGEAGVERKTAANTLAAMLPSVVDKLSPDGEVDEQRVVSRIGGFLSGWGGAASGTVASGFSAATASGIGDKIGDTTGNVGDKTSATLNNVGGSFGSDGDGEGDGSGIMKWLLPLIILALLVGLLFWFCGRSNTPITGTTNTNVNVNRAMNGNANRGNTNVTAVDSSFSIKADNGKYTVSGVVNDPGTLDDIKSKLDAHFGAGNVDYSGLKVDPGAKPFADGWWKNFENLLPNLKDWNTGTLAFAGNAITSASGLPSTALDQLRSLFTGWTLPGSLDPENAAKTANEEATKALAAAGSVEEVIKALNVSIINFASGKSDIPEDAKGVLAKAADVLKKQAAGPSIEIGGHTDSDGADDANMKLSQARADAVRKALVDLGVTESMLTAKGYGETQPLSGNTNSSDDEKYANRRIEYKTATGDSPSATTIETRTNSAVANSNGPR